MTFSADDRDALARYDQLLQRVYTERRMPPATRDLILALGWVALRDPRRHAPALSKWERAHEVMNVDHRTIWQALRGDAPRYEYDWHAGPHGCQAPMVRVDRLCEKSPSLQFSEFDPATGWMTPWGFCSRLRCREYARPIYERAHGSHERAPEPIPNTGGLLPLFFRWNWESYYRKADPTWEPPSYGLSADEWPTVPGAEPVLAFPKLRLVASEGEIVANRFPVPVS